MKAQRVESDPGKFVKFFNYSPARSALWNAAEVPGLMARDLGAHAASVGDLSARLVRCESTSAEGFDWSSQDADLRFIYVLAGNATLSAPDGDVVLGEHDAYSILRGYKARLIAISSGFEAIELTLQAKDGDPLGDGSRRAFHSPLTDQSFQTGNGLRRFFAYRDVGTSALTGGRVHIQTMKTIDTPQGGTGWHYHSMSQFAMGFTGVAVVDLDGQHSATIGPRDAISIPRGCIHNLSSLSAEYSLIEVCLPVKYDTIAIEEPNHRYPYST